MSVPQWIDLDSVYLKIAGVTALKSMARPGNYFEVVPPDHLLLDRSPNIGPLTSRWELDKFKNC